MLRESINEVVEAFERLIETLEDNGVDPSVVEVVEDAKDSFLEMHASDDEDIEDLFMIVIKMIRIAIYPLLTSK